MTTVPCSPWVAPVIVRHANSGGDRVFGSVSLARTSMLAGQLSSAIVAESSLATGASGTAVKLMVTVAGALSLLPSLAVYLKVTAPKKLAAGVYVKEPSGSRSSEPLDGGVCTSKVKAPPS